MLYEESGETHFDEKAHTIYDRYGWTPNIVENMPLDEVDKHYKLIKAVEKAEMKKESETFSALTKFLSKLFHNYLGKRTIM